jgi:O-antigen/teichoic acid export membrane protein
MFIWSIALIGIIIVMPVIILYLFGKEFIPSILSAQVLVASLSIMGIAYFCNSILIVYKKVVHMVVVNFISAVTNVAFDILLVPLLGIAGAAYATAISFCIGSLCYYFIARHLVKSTSYSALLFLLPVILLMVFIIFHIRLWMAMIVIIIIYYLIVKLSPVFKQDNENIIEKIQMPTLIKHALIKLHVLLARI